MKQSRTRKNPIGLGLRKRRDEWWTYLGYWLSKKHVPQKRFVILTQWRSGSELLIDLLNCHPDIRCDSELFKEFVRLRTPKVLFPHWYLDGKSARAGTKAYGCKIMSNQLIGIIAVSYTHLTLPTN